MPGPEDRYTEEEEYENFGFGDYASAFGTGAATGAMAGLKVPVVGPVIGGLVGGGVGLISTAFENKQQKEAFEQQQALQRELDTAGADIESFVQDSAISAGRQADQAGDAAAFSARRAGLNPFQTEQLSNAIRSEAQVKALESQGQRVQAAQAATRAAQEGILNQYLTAQKLQNDATPGSGLDEAFSTLAANAALLSELESQSAGQPVPVTDAPSTATELDTAFGYDQSAPTFDDIIAGESAGKPVVYSQAQPMVPEPVDYLEGAFEQGKRITALPERPELSAAPWADIDQGAALRPTGAPGIPGGRGTPTSQLMRNIAMPEAPVDSSTMIAGDALPRPQAPVYRVGTEAEAEPFVAETYENMESAVAQRDSNILRVAELEHINTGDLSNLPTGTLVQAYRALNLGQDQNRWKLGLQNWDAEVLVEMLKTEQMTSPEPAPENKDQ